ncbi:hypothetical protein KJ782_06600 [Patescibacteria group bacterium]|nr:hypothetical protein [Patescibacteria group bacterium]
MPQIIKELEDRIYNKNILHQDEEAQLKNFMNGAIKTTFLPEDIWLDNLNKFLDVIDIGTVDDYHFCKYFKFFFAKQKS